MAKYYFGQDGQIINDIVLKEFDLSVKNKEYTYSNGELVYDFVGFVYKNDKVLVVFPKHYFDSVKNITENDIELLFNVIKEYNSDSNRTIAEKYYGYINNYESDYPFEAFYKIYDYYKKYGLYKDNIIIEKANSSNNISWKTTIRKSNIIVSDNNLMYLPLYSKSYSNKNNFIGECMTYIINYTIKTFPFFNDLKKINENSKSIDLMQNREVLLRELYKYKNIVFKDSEIKLIESIIQFIKEFDRKANGGSIHIKIKYFNLVWERMVNRYLNEYFIGVDNENRKLIFNSSKINNCKFNAKDFTLDNRFSDKNIIRPDFYYEKEKDIYVFDAKYYENLKELNYKQVAYTLLLGNSQLKNNKNICSALFMPGIHENGLHLVLNDNFKQLKEGCNYIIEQFLDMHQMMKNYINLSI